MTNRSFFEPTPARAHQGRDRFFGAVFVCLVVLGVVSLFYSLNLVTVAILVGLSLLVVGIGWLAGSVGGGPDR
jgi:protein-S-isoprenylcysteine O-methyltransferase Ste14